MQPYPHVYHASASRRGDVELESGRLPSLRSASPAEFGGPGNRWSPETLLVAAVADCLVLTFRAIARSSNFAFESIRCDVAGRLDRVEKGVAFTDILVRAHLRLAPGTSADEARSLLTRAKRHCLITNSLTAATTFDIDIEAPESPGQEVAAGS